MNPAVIKIGVGVAVAAATFIIAMFYQRRQERSNAQACRPMDIGNYNGNNQSRCYICLQDYEEKSANLVKLSCNHKFHGKCISEVFKNEAPSQRSCPVCRRHITDREAVSVHTM